MGSSFPYGICRMCGNYPPMDSMSALLMPSFLDLARIHLHIEIKETDKCSQLVCRPCVQIVKNFDIYSSTVKHTQRTIEQYILFNIQESEAAQSAVKIKIEDDVIVIIDDIETTTALEAPAQNYERPPDQQDALLPGTSSATVAKTAAPMVVIPMTTTENEILEGDQPMASSSKRNHSKCSIRPTSTKQAAVSTPKPNTQSAPKRRKTISETCRPQEYILENTKCSFCAGFVKTKIEQVFHEHVHEKRVCLYCNEAIGNGSELVNHFHKCFLTQCRSVDVLVRYVKRCYVRADQESLATHKTKPAASAVTHSTKRKKSQKAPRKSAKSMVGPSLLLSENQAKLCVKMHKDSTGPCNSQYVPVTLVLSTNTQKCTASNECSSTSLPKRYRLNEKEPVLQRYEGENFLSTVQKIHALKSKNKDSSKNRNAVIVAADELNDSGDRLPRQPAPILTKQEPRDGEEFVAKLSGYINLVSDSSDGDDEPRLVIDESPPQRQPAASACAKPSKVIYRRLTVGPTRPERNKVDARPCKLSVRRSSVAPPTMCSPPFITKAPRVQPMSVVPQELSVSIQPKLTERLPASSSPVAQAASQVVCFNLPAAPVPVIVSNGYVLNIVQTMPPAVGSQQSVINKLHEPVIPPPLPQSFADALQGIIPKTKYRSLQPKPNAAVNNGGNTAITSASVIPTMSQNHDTLLRDTSLGSPPSTPNRSLSLSTEAAAQPPFLNSSLTITLKSQRTVDKPNQLLPRRKVVNTFKPKQSTLSQLHVRSPQDINNQYINNSLN